MATYSIGFKNLTYGTKAIAVEGLTKEKAMGMKESMKTLETEDVKVFVKIEMNKHERQTDLLIQNAVSEIIGGFENLLEDSEEGSDDWTEAKETLNHDELFKMIYNDVMSESRSNYASHIRFAGKEFIEDRIEARLKKEGYGK